MRLQKEEKLYLRSKMTWDLQFIKLVNRILKKNDFCLSFAANILRKQIFQLIQAKEKILLEECSQSTSVPTSLATLISMIIGGSSISESVTSTAMLRHTTGVVKQILLKINPEQSVVLTADQPVYALGKQVQWMHPKSYGESDTVMMMGALHIEMVFLDTIGDWLEGSPKNKCKECSINL